MDDGRVLTVSQVNELVRMTLDSSPFLTSVSVRGELTNLTVHRTGHLYFRVKDAGSVLSAVMFRSSAAKLKFLPENGMKVILHGRVQVFARDGVYQLYCDDLQPDGIGAQYLALEQLKRRLAAEGLFDPSKKKPLPKIPLRIGVITSPTGAAIRDILNITKRRFPLAKIYLFPALVQGSAAPPTLIEGLRFFNTRFPVDLLILGRGGGSAEELWAFNDEALAREVAASRIPVISAVGHEIDFTLCDFAADLRAPTPSAAAEMAVPDTAALVRQFGNAEEKLRRLLSGRLEACRNTLSRLASSRVLRDPRLLLDEKQMTLLSLSDRLDAAQERLLAVKKTELARLSSVLSAVSPLQVLARGYGVVRHENGTVVRAAGECENGETITVSLHDGQIGAVVTERKENGTETNL